MLYDNPVPVEEIDVLIDQKYEMKRDKAKLLVNAYAEVKGLLTDDQYNKMKEVWMSQKEG